MPNPIYTDMMQNASGGMYDVINAFNNFKRQFSGNPRQKVQELLSTGQMSQQQFNQLSQMTNQFISLMSGKI